MLSTTLLEKLETFGWLDGLKCAPSLCRCAHQLQNTQAVFFQSQGLLYCARCQGFQEIKKPVS